MQNRNPLAVFLSFLTAWIFQLGTLSISATAQTVVLYTSIDAPLAKPIVERFERETGITVRLVTDGEATKTAGLAKRLLAEKDRPRADVYWNNEIFHTLSLAREDCFTPLPKAIVDSRPAGYRDSNSMWVATGLRARVIVVSSREKDQAIVSQISTLESLGLPHLKGKIAMSNPAFGTASGHMASLYMLWGEEKFTRVLQSWRENDIKLLGGNSVVVDQVAAGSIVVGLTDNDDVASGLSQGKPVAAVIPDQLENQSGTLLIPATVSLVKSGPNPIEAEKLATFLASPEVERELLEAKFFACSIHEIDSTSPAASPHTMPAIRTISVDWNEASIQMKHAVELALRILQDRK